MKEQGKPGEIPMFGVSGGTDGSVLLLDSPKDTAYVMFGPGNDTMHCVNESLPKAMYFDFIGIYDDIINEYMGISK